MSSYIFISDDLKSSLGSAVRGATAPAGSYAREVAGLGPIPNPARLTAAERESFGIPEVIAGVYDAASEIVTGADFTRAGDGTIQMVGGKVTEVLVTEALPAAEIAAAEAAAISAEAERRIAVGLVLSSGVRFRCDTLSMTRLTGMKASTVWPKTFKTAAGVTVTLNSQAEAQAVFDECDAYVTDVLASSASLQDAPPVDVMDDANWPSDGSI